MPSQRNKAFLTLAGASAVLAAAIAAAWCDRQHEKRDLVLKAEAMTGGNVDRGEVAFTRYGCGGCHSVLGMAGAHGMVGPPLDGVAARAIIGGRLENRPDNMMRWIRAPQLVSPGTAMPDLGVSPRDSQDIAAFLYTRT